MVPAHIDNQIRIAKLAAYVLHYQGGIGDDILELAKLAGISRNRLFAMAKFIQTKGEPKNFTRFS